MSHFIATQISFSKDRTTFKVKGGSNNVIPRSNEWTHDIPIKELFFEVSFGNIQFTKGNTKGFIIKHLAKQIEKDFGGSWDTKDDLYHQKKSPRAMQFSDRFISELFIELAKEKDDIYIITSGSQYIKSMKRGGAYLTSNIDQAQRYGLAKAKQILTRFTGKGLSIQTI